MDMEAIIQWYAVQTIYCREMMLKDILDKAQIQSFIPTKYESVVKNEEKQYFEIPAVHNLVFIRSSKEKIDELRRKNIIEFHYIKDFETNKPIIISDKEMDVFIQITELAKEDIIFLRDNFEKFKKNIHIRISGGRFKGIEGYLVRIRRDRKVVVMIKGIAAVAISGIDSSLIEIIE